MDSSPTFSQPTAYSETAHQSTTPKEPSGDSTTGKGYIVCVWVVFMMTELVWCPALFQKFTLTRGEALVALYCSWML